MHELGGAARGHAVYIAGAAVHLVNVATGRDRTLTFANTAPPVYAALTDAGLFVSYNQAYSRPHGRVVFIPQARLARG